MATIQFYHLLSTPLETALPKLLEKALTGDNRVVLHSADNAQLAALSEVLWQHSAFLPHGDAEAKYAAQQPILLSNNAQNKNNAKVLAIIDGSLPELAGYEKILDIFDGNNESEVAAARSRWAHYKNAGLQLQYIRQQPGGSWKIEQ